MLVGGGRELDGGGTGGVNWERGACRFRFYSSGGGAQGVQGVMPGGGWRQNMSVRCCLQKPDSHASRL